MRVGKRRRDNMFDGGEQRRDDDNFEGEVGNDEEVSQAQQPFSQAQSSSCFQLSVWLV